MRKLSWLEVAAIATAGPAMAQPATCPSTTVTSPVGDIAAWSRNRKVHVADDFRREIVRDFCAAAAPLVTTTSAGSGELHISPVVIAQVRAAAINDYLDNYTDPMRAVRTVRAVLRSHLGVSGFSRPVARTRGLVRITYRRPVERLQLRGQQLDPWPRFLLLPGPANYAGLDGGQAVCRGQVTVSVAAAAAVTC